MRLIADTEASDGVVMSERLVAPERCGDYMCRCCALWAAWVERLISANPPERSREISRDHEGAYCWCLTSEVPSYECFRAAQDLDPDG